MPEKYQYVILKKLNKRRYRRHASFHMPGHKGAASFKKRFPLAAIDVTELSYSDNLHSPEGIIAEAQRDIAEILGAYASYITTDGSTSGVYALMYAAAKRGGKVIVPRNSHRSVYNACRLLNVEPVIVQGRDKGNVLLMPEPELVEKMFAGDGDISAVIITSPDYYGNIAPLEQYAAIAKKYNRLLLVDGAHGAHLAFEKGRGGYCGKYADMWVDGAHKNLPSLTQGAILNISSEKFRADAEEALGLFRTTSPSYPIMASVEYGVKYLANNPEKTERAKQAAEAFKKRLVGWTFYPSDDWAKVVVDFKPMDIDASLAERALEKKNIYVELCDGRYMIIYISAMTGAKQLKKLAAALESVADNKKLRGTYRDRHLPIPQSSRTYSYLYALNQPWEYVALSEAEGRMSAENVGVNPPCVPVVVAGEIYTSGAVNMLKHCGSTFGIVHGKVKVLKA